ncbi:MAG: hypothetical protein ACYDHW_01275 [Syntrophorhabdaceae bacterium]
MKEVLVSEYEKRILNLLKDVKALFKDSSFGAHKNIISSTLPFMVLEKWREDGHSSDVPLLDDAVKNIVVATALLIFGWTKTSCLHIRVALENVFSGVTLLNSPRSLSTFRSAGIITYKPFKNMVNEYEKANPILTAVSKRFDIKDTSLELYDDLSKWSHTLGDSFISDLSILGYSKLNNANIGKMKSRFITLARISSIVYLSIRPSIFQNISSSQQRLFLTHLKQEERKNLREIIGL